jgi:hypothetical protein
VKTDSKTRKGELHNFSFCVADDDDDDGVSTQCSIM